MVSTLPEVVLVAHLSTQNAIFALLTTLDASNVPKGMSLVLRANVIFVQPTTTTVINAPLTTVVLRYVLRLMESL